MTPSSWSSRCQAQEPAAAASAAGRSGGRHCQTASTRGRAQPPPLTARSARAGGGGPAVHQSPTSQPMRPSASATQHPAIEPPTLSTRGGRLLVEGAGWPPAGCSRSPMDARLGCGIAPSCCDPGAPSPLPLLPALLLRLQAPESWDAAARPRRGLRPLPSSAGSMGDRLPAAGVSGAPLPCHETQAWPPAGRVCSTVGQMGPAPRRSPKTGRQAARHAQQGRARLKERSFTEV